MAPPLHTGVLFRPPSPGGPPGRWIFGSAIASTGSCWPRSPWVACSGRSCICDGLEGLSCHGRPGGCWCCVCSRAPCWPSGRERPGGPGSAACWRARRRRTPPPWSAGGHATLRLDATGSDSLYRVLRVSSGPGWPPTRRFTRCTRFARSRTAGPCDLVDVESDQGGDGHGTGGGGARSRWAGNTKATSARSCGRRSLGGLRSTKSPGAIGRGPGSPPTCRCGMRPDEWRRCWGWTTMRPTGRRPWHRYGSQSSR